MATEAEGVSNWGYSETGNPLLVPESALVTLCRLCHSVLEDSRRRLVKLREGVVDPETGPPLTEIVGWRNIFQLWELNGRTVPFDVIKESWLQLPSHFIRVERVVIKKGHTVSPGVAMFVTAWPPNSSKLAEQERIAGVGLKANVCQRRSTFAALLIPFECPLIQERAGNVLLRFLQLNATVWAGTVRDKASARTAESLARQGFSGTGREGQG
ncbi:MAG: hypothetical protein E5X00_12635 [Mesorhizobium sp.]|nr:MAG: hypothetical protein E5X09_08650 [Mesorhizobium sp.]TIS80571.1 MAG: hypothetical protein E5X00_12635 [Mesorhizobium sp.]